MSNQRVERETFSQTVGRESGSGHRARKFPSAKVGVPVENVENVVH
jgi:hypothetical protein